VSPTRGPGAPGDSPAAAPIDRRRYLRVLAYFARVFLHVVWFDFLLARPGLAWLRPAPEPRWRRLARRFRELAIELGGVLIKLGQFLSTRVDVLPPEVTDELSGLQDRVPAVPFDDLVVRLEEDFGPGAAARFHSFDRQPAGAASLAQVHRARLSAADATPGEAVVVKLLRPGIETLVETDLAASRMALGWLKLWRRVRDRVDLDRLMDEFADTTRAELDLSREADNAERFAEQFRDTPEIGVPRVHRHLTGRHTLTLEDVGTLKVSDHAALDELGISRPALARTLFSAYVDQIFEHHFVHCDPHPGNLFVQVREPSPEESPEVPGTPFRLVFIDFGMMTTVPASYRTALRELAIAFVARDSSRVVAAAQQAGILLPGADLARIEAVHDDVFERLWGVKLADLQDAALAQAGYFFREYRDLLYEMPFQFPEDLLFTLRAVGLLSGMATSLDPDFNPWEEARPYAEEMARQEAGPLAERLLEGGEELVRTLVQLPAALRHTLKLARREGVAVRASLAPDARRAGERIERAIGRIAWSVAAGALFLGGVQMELGRPETSASVWMWGLSALLFGWGVLRGR
jgi:predicted unusual protein kinase regulating ubiquinone biosynthesis (AarF/ABC1/UbiB family)